MSAEPQPIAPWRRRLYSIIFQADNRAGRLFDAFLLWAILLSVLATMLQSSRAITAAHGELLTVIEWLFTGLFAVEYLLRIISSEKPLRYVFSFLGIIDLLAVLPSFVGLVFDIRQHFLILRVIRLLRVFRIFKLSRYLKEAKLLMQALRESRHKILVFLGAVLTMVMVLGTVMYSIEGEENGFTSIPRSIYWAIVTLTTVGYGDIAPKTIVGQALASLIMLLGYSIIAVPTGLVTAGFIKRYQDEKNPPPDIRRCPGCNHERHDPDAKFCKHCGTRLRKKRKA